MTQPITLPYHVDVTQAMIDSGEPGDCDACPVALSLYSQLLSGSPEKNIYVEVQRKKIDINGWIYETPQSVDEFIGRFDYEDEDLPVEPFEFIITNRYDTIKEVSYE